MYQTLYRKYRPKVFEDVVGQEHIVATLKHEVREQKTAHAYLFTGSRGTGKTTCSKILSKAVNCLHPNDGDPCLACDICKGIEEGSILDVVEIDAASNNGVENIRQLRDEANFTPAVAKYRVYIIDEAHMLSVGAFNALLKIMEEPPKHVLFILATTEVHKLPATILSRCQRFDFGRIPPEKIAGRLLQIAETEQLSLQEDAARFIAQLSDGGMRDALSLLDLAASSNGDITVRTVTEAAGITGHAHLLKLSEAIGSGNIADALEIVNALHQNSVDFERLCEECIDFYRNLMLLKSVKDAQRLINWMPDELEALKEAAEGYTLVQILHILTAFQNTLNQLNKTPSKRMEFEICLIKLCNPQLDSSGEAILRRIEALENQLKSGVLPQVRPSAQAQPSPQVKKKPAAQKQEPSDPLPEEPPEETLPEYPQEMAAAAGKAEASPAPEKAGQTGAAPSDLQPLSSWPEIMEALYKINPALHGALHGSCAYLQGDLVLIDAPDMLFLQLIRQSNYAKDTLRQAIQQQTGKTYRLGPYRREAKAEAVKLDPLEKLVHTAQEMGIDTTVK
ncbi:DNA polymerase III subunit gamma/tau [Candidatus Soleaferrea massiliensis]|uniref:DNA polymerase III subunit gamma/tau n=1 Tax=Candidatus Soleaferrea massiliensis TaxID=1470354 RepID=UPI00058C6A9B|nr:DNA polymerase III subunit gamma/tau [Candidatus Soleaferrea massiliensis]